MSLEYYLWIVCLRCHFGKQFNKHDTYYNYRTFVQSSKRITLLTLMTYSVLSQWNSMIRFHEYVYRLLTTYLTHLLECHFVRYFRDTSYSSETRFLFNNLSYWRGKNGDYHGWIRHGEIVRSHILWGNVNTHWYTNGTILMDSCT